ncbi:MAG: hypothetical protein KKE86_13825, partial [Planctomycetes bacterium]|nr:hypothetical protein [Planctomycetota bacterium]
VGTQVFRRSASASERGDDSDAERRGQCVPMQSMGTRGNSISGSHAPRGNPSVPTLRVGE